MAATIYGSYKNAIVLDVTENQIAEFSSNIDFDFTLLNAFFENNIMYLATKEFGILKTSISQINSFQEIHPEGPLSNDVFSIAVKDNHLWVVYGGYDAIYTPTLNKQGFSHFNGENWINTKFNIDFPVIDLNYISIDPTTENKVYISYK